MKPGIFKKVISFLSFIILLVLMSCSSRPVFEQYHKFSKMTWERFDYVKFNVPVENVDEEYDISLVIRHLPEFQLKTLPINFTMYMPSGEMRTFDTDLDFFDKDGKSLRNVWAITAISLSCFIKTLNSTNPEQ